MTKGIVFLRDYTHASKTFRSNFYQNAPKFKFLFHVYFDINPLAYPENTSTGANFGLLVKTARLPSYNFMTTELNQYNRKRIVQTKVKYDPVEIVFHDDNRNLINSLWIKYFTYYYKDSSNQQVSFQGEAITETGVRDVNPSNGTAAIYNMRNQYDPNQDGISNWTWGFTGDTNEPYGTAAKKVPFFKNITIYGLENHNFTSYTLINPIITKFSHDTYSYAEGNGTMENRMTLEYETVVYNQGSIDGTKPSDIVTGFGDKATYDRTLSPWARPGSNANILKDNNLVPSFGGAIQAFNTGNYAEALSKAGVSSTLYNKLNLGGPISPTVKAAIRDAIFNALNTTRQRMVDVPIYGATPSPLTTNAGNNITYDIVLNPQAGQQQTPPV